MGGSNVLVAVILILPLLNHYFDLSAWVVSARTLYHPSVTGFIGFVSFFASFDGLYKQGFFFSKDMDRFDTSIF